MASNKRALLGEGFRKIQPKLRVISNGSTIVNALRSEQFGAVTVSDAKVLSDISLTVTDQTAPVKAETLGRAARKGKLDALPKNVHANVFIRMLRPGSEKLSGESARRDNVVTATVTMNELKQLAENASVSFIGRRRECFRADARYFQKQSRRPARENESFDL